MEREASQVSISDQQLVALMHLSMGEGLTNRELNRLMGKPERDEGNTINKIVKPLLDFGFVYQVKGEYPKKLLYIDPKMFWTLCFAFEKERIKLNSILFDLQGELMNLENKSIAEETKAYADNISKMSLEYYCMDKRLKSFKKAEEHLRQYAKSDIIRA